MLLVFIVILTCTRILHIFKSLLDSYGWYVILQRNTCGLYVKGVIHCSVEYLMAVLIIYGISHEADSGGVKNRTKWHFD